MSILKDGIQISKRAILRNVILFAAFFTFYFVFCLHILPKVIGTLGDITTLQAMFSFTIAATMIAYSFSRKYIVKTYIIPISIIMTSALTFLLIFVANYILIAVMVLFIGIFFSIGQLSFFIHFWYSTSSEERGRIGGLIGFIALPFYYFINILASSDLSINTTIIIGVMLSLIPVVALLLKPKNISSTTRKIGFYPEKRTIILYSIPWIIFSIINATLAKNITINTSEFVSSSILVNLVLLQTFSALIGALIGGWIADFFGRRLALATSVTLYGMGVALSGFIQNETLYYFVFTAEGLSWGILLTLYSFVIWGDLSNKDNCAKMYSIGLLIFYFSAGIGQVPSELSQIPLIASAFIACMLIFFSNAPIALAPELASMQLRDRIKMKMHIKAAKKAAKKYESQG